MRRDPGAHPVATPAAPPPGGLRTYLLTLYQHSLVGEDFEDDVEIEVRSFRGDRPLHSYRAAKSIPAAIRLIKADSGAGANVFNGVHLRRRDTERSGNDSVAVLSAIICDIDCAKGKLTREDAIAAVEQSPFGAPTMIVWSGGGIHGYWVYRERVDATPENIEAHRMGCAYLRHWLQSALGSNAVDDMSTADRILRSPGTFNMKPGRAENGRPPPVEVLSVREDRMVDIADVVDIVPPAFDPNAHAVRAQRARAPGDALDLPTEVPARIARVLAQAKIPFRLAMRGPHVEAIKLLPCPACGQSDGGCYLTARFGTLRTYHATSCPAAHHPGGIPLDEWVARYAPECAPRLDAPAPPSQAQVTRAERLASALAVFTAEPEPAATAGFSDAALVGLACTEAWFISPSQTRGLPTRGIAATASAIARAAPRGGAVLVPLRDASGAVRQGVWACDGTKLPAALAFSRGDDAVAGGVLTAGSIPAAIDAGTRGRVVYLAFGSAVDYLATVGAAAALDESSMVLGVLDSPDKVCAALAAAWVRAEVRPQRIVAIGEPTGAVTAALKILDGVAGVVLVEMPGGAERTMAAGATIESVKRRVRTATWHHKPPIHIASAEAAIAADLTRAAIFAANTSTDDRHTLVVYCLPPGGGKTTAAQIIAGKIATGEIVVPVRGRRPKSIPESMWPPEDRAVAIALPNHPLAAEKHDDHLGRLALTVPADRFKGALEYCHFADRVRPAYAAVGRRGICGDEGKPNRCHLADTCPGARRPEPQRGVVSYVTHAMVRHLKWDFAFVDEDTGVIDVSQVPVAEIETIYSGYPIPRVRRWRTEINPDAPIVTQMLVEVMDDIARDHAANVGAGLVEPYDRRIEGEALCRLLESRAKLTQALDVAFADDKLKPPMPTPDELRSGADIHKHVPSMAAWRALRAMNAFYKRCRAKPSDEPLKIIAAPESPKPITSLVVHPGGSWSVETRSIKPLPSCPVVLLDATGDLTLAEYQAAYPQYRVTQMQMQLWGSQPKRSIHIQTKACSRANTFTRRGALKPDAATRIRNIITLAVAEARAGRSVAAGRLRVGVLSYLGVYDYIEGKRTGGGVLGTLRATLDAQGVDLLTGYFGRDDRGTNRFEQVDALVVIGDARQNLGAVDSDCLLLGLDPKAVIGDRATAVVVQAIFRARHTRRAKGREPVIVLAASQAPHVPGIVWERASVPIGRREKLAEAMDAVAFVLGDTGVIGYRPMVLFRWQRYDVEPPVIPRAVLDEAISRHVEASGAALAPYVVHYPNAGAPSRIWAVSPRHAAVWAECVIGSMRVEPGDAEDAI